MYACVYVCQEGALHVLLGHIIYYNGVASTGHTVWSHSVIVFTGHTVWSHSVVVCTGHTVWSHSVVVCTGHKTFVT